MLRIDPKAPDGQVQVVTVAELRHVRLMVEKAFREGYIKGAEEAVAPAEERMSDDPWEESTAYGVSAFVFEGRGAP